MPYAIRIGAPPQFINVPARVSAWGNHQYGDCVTAEEAFAKACNSTEIFLSDDVVIEWARSHGVLGGASLQEVMGFMQDDGFKQGSATYNDGPSVAVNWEDTAALQSAISVGPVKIGVAAEQLEHAYLTGQGVTGWFATGFKPDPGMDHCVSLCGYGSISWLAQQLNVQVPTGVDGTAAGYALFTWGSIGIIDEASLMAITHEAWLRQPTTVTI
jgi:hypothetical protein